MGIPHIIAVDLDGTLLTDEKKITPKTKKVLQKLSEKGHHVVISTGRPYRASHMYYKELELTTPIVNFNGSYVHHPHDRHFAVEHKPMDLQTTREIIAKVKEIGMRNVVAEGLQNVYAYQTDEDLNNFFPIDTIRFHEGNVLEMLQEDPTSLMISSPDENVAAIRNHLSEAHGAAVVHRKWDPPYGVIEVMKQGVSKATGLMRVSEHLGIPKERIIAFGDENNDLEMIDYVGHGVVMENGIPELKSLADEITLSNEEDGVARYLEEYFNL